MISRAPLAQIEAFQKRMGWRFPWVSSYGTDFNRDYHVSFTKDERARRQGVLQLPETEFPSDEAPGASVFYKDKDRRLSSTLIPPTVAGWTFWWARTTFWTWRPRAATKRA